MDLRKAICELSETLTRDRHELHAHPELSFKEEKTTEYIAKRLESMGIPVMRYPSYYGLVGTIAGKAQGKTVLLRADIDALPIKEASGVSFASQNIGVMHACGHDAHTAMLLGAAKVLKEESKNFLGTVKLLFQSAEESGNGAPFYIKNGILKDVDAAFAIHVQPGLPLGTISLDAGLRSTSCTNFNLTITGTSAHGSTPHLGHDAIVAASAVIMDIQTLVSRISDPLNPLVVTIGKVEAGKQFNIICDEVKLEGTIRTYDRDLFEGIPKKLEALAQGTAEAMDCHAKMDVVTHEPLCSNDDPALLDAASKAAVSLWGEEALVTMPAMMASEDFAFIMDEVPSVIAYLGTGTDTDKSPLHSNTFRIDDAVLPRGAGIYAGFALNVLGKEG